MPDHGDDDRDDTAEKLAEAMQTEQKQERSEQQAELARQGDVDTRIAEALSQGAADRDGDPAI